MPRMDSFLLGMVAGATLLAAAFGLAKVLITKGYTIAVELAEAGWHPRELRAHRKQAIVLPWIQRARAEGQSQR